MEADEQPAEALIPQAFAGTSGQYLVGVQVGLGFAGQERRAGGGDGDLAGPDRVAGVLAALFGQGVRPRKLAGEPGVVSGTEQPAGPVLAVGAQVCGPL